MAHLDQAKRLFQVWIMQENYHTKKEHWRTCWNLPSTVRLKSSKGLSSDESSVQRLGNPKHWMKGQQAKRQVSWVNPVTRPVDPGHRAVLKVWTYTLDKWLHFKIYLSPHHSSGPFFSDFWSGASFERNNFLNVFIFWVSSLRSPNLGLRQNMSSAVYY